MSYRDIIPPVNFASREKIIAEMRAMANHEGDCLMWNRGTLFSGKIEYGYFQFDNTSYLAHRVMYALCNNVTVTSSMIIRHSCDCGLCIEGVHLIAGTYKDNARDMFIRGRATRRLTPEDVRLIRELYETGEHSQSDIARMFCALPVTIHNIVKKKTWQYL